jgi:Na+/H+-translocating membrane pyrophosphatase
MLCTYIIVFGTQYYTEYAYYPIRTIMKSSSTCHSTNMIVGISVRITANFISSITAAIAVLTAYHMEDVLVSVMEGMGSIWYCGIYNRYFGYPCFFNI